jgi:hypothetical protein
MKSNARNHFRLLLSKEIEQFDSLGCDVSLDSLLFEVFHELGLADVP